jgi:large subunit ribosomal protein L29
MTVKADEIRALGPEELDKQIEEARRELFNLRFRLETRQLANYREIQKVKRKIARMLTIKRERELAIR